MIEMIAARNVEERNVLAISTDTKSNTTYCVYQRIAVVIVDFSADAADVHVDYVSGRIEIQIPDVLQQHGARYDPFRVAYEIFEDAEFSR